jgi:serine/threonine protein kinase
MSREGDKPDNADVASAPTLAADVASAPTLDVAKAPTLDSGAPAPDAASRAAAPAVGATLDHFRLVDELGAGGMGLVFLAEDTRLGRKVALKLIRPKLLASSGLAGLLDEARTTACFNHEHIVTIHHVGHESATPYIAFEYLEGQTLRERLVLQRNAEPDALELIGQARAIVSALAQAHRHGVAHGDLKPENVMLPNEAPLRVLDFGLAAAVDGGEEQVGIRGTPAYLAPEQWQGRRASPASDVWSFGILLYELLFRRLPFSAKSFPEIEQKVRDGYDSWPPPKPTSRRLRPLVELMRSCLQSEPAKRPRADQLLERLEALGADERRRRRPMGAVASALMVFFGVMLSQGMLALLALMFAEWNESYMSASNIASLEGK